ncbi:PREDICTED: non-functional NADPH-dependent codeinone reductase 2-like [Tarenaya hassleriana]|uniref:non-functional NADPH-dependent codeinone reductase 2-like n=1 Tax=Tarenaya hassleriana TaxID=28532 RepID=UPI00053C5FAC|nr:PREDICTED: non-functional NADPH-dependent codeinone reductase 2-like [Tarenaya hassleriana]
MCVIVMKYSVLVKPMSPPVKIPTLSIGSDHHRIPVIGFGTAASAPPDPAELKLAVIDAVKLGYRHFDTSPRYQTEEPLGEALSEAISSGLVGSRDELFVTSKLWCADAHRGLVVPAIRRSLQKLRLDYLDLYLVHWPVASKPGKYNFPIEEFMPFDFEAVWSEMEECKRLGLAKCIGVSNFSCKKLQHILSVAKIPPCINQVEMSPVWQQRKLRELCESNGIVLTAYSVLGSRGAFWGTDKVMESDVLKEIAKSKGKTVAQVSLRWAYEQGVSMVVKSFNRERLEENLHIFEWSLTKDENQRIATQIPQRRVVLGEPYISPKGTIKSVEEMWDGEF